MEKQLIIEKITGKSIPIIFKNNGEKKFRELEKKIIKFVNSTNECIFSFGGGVILDSKNRTIINKNSLVIWLWSSIKNSINRIPKGSRPILDVKKPQKKAKTILQNRIPLYASIADIIIKNDNEPIEKVSERIYNEINKLIIN